MGTPWKATEDFLVNLKEIKERKIRAKEKDPDDHKRHMKETNGMVIYPHPHQNKLLDFTENHSKK